MFNGFNGIVVGWIVNDGINLNMELLLVFKYVSFENIDDKIVFLDNGNFFGKDDFMVIGKIVDFYGVFVSYVLFIVGFFVVVMFFCVLFIMILLVIFLCSKCGNCY